MPKSMTGFSNAETEAPNGKCSGEARSLNSRYLEVSLRLPKSASAYEQRLRELGAPTKSWAMWMASDSRAWRCVRDRVVMDGSCRRTVVEAAFLVLRPLPPPAARAEVLAGLDGPGAGGAADGRETGGVQGMGGDAVFLREGPEARRVPVQQGRDLQALGRAAVGVGELHVHHVEVVRLGHESQQHEPVSEPH